MSFVAEKPDVDGEQIRKLSGDAPLPIQTEEKPEIDGESIRQLPEGAPVGLTSSVAPVQAATDSKPLEVAPHDDKNLTVASV